MKINPFLFDATTDLKSIADPFLKKNRLNYFQYASVFADETTHFLVTHPEFVKMRIKENKRTLSHFEPTQINEQTYMFLWNEALPEDDVRGAQDFGIHNGLCFVERFKDHYNLIAFGAPALKKNINTFYMNNTNKLWNFVKEFKIQGEELLNKAYENRFFIPDENNDVNRKNLFLKNNKRTITWNNLNFSLSPMEYSCLELVGKCNTINSIAQELKLSPRTVETYLLRIKCKTGLSSKNDLAKFYQDIFYLN